MICLNENKIIIEEYQELISVSLNEIVVLRNDKNVIIYGDNLKVIALEKSEIQIEGDWKGLHYLYEK